MHTQLFKITNWSEMAEQAEWRVGALAKNSKVSVRTLERFIKTKFKKTPKSWMTEQRQLWAAERLKEGLWSKEIAEIGGYENHSQFSREFKAYWGRSPKQHAKNSN